MFQEVSTKGVECTGVRMAIESTHGCMQNNSIGDEGACDLARALEHNACIKRLDVRVWFNMPKSGERAQWMMGRWLL